MNDHKFTLRLAKIVETFTFWAHVAPSVRADMQSLVRDIEAAGIDMPPVPERRTITREEFGRGIEVLMRIGTVHKRDVDELLSWWRLTVEDA